MQLVAMREGWGHARAVCQCYLQPGSHKRAMPPAPVPASPPRNSAVLCCPKAGASSCNRALFRPAQQAHGKAGGPGNVPPTSQRVELYAEISAKCAEMCGLTPQVGLEVCGVLGPHLAHLGQEETNRGPCLSLLVFAVRLTMQERMTQTGGAIGAAASGRLCPQ